MLPLQIRLSDVPATLELPPVQAFSRLCQPKPIAGSRRGAQRGRMAKSTNPFRYFDSSPEVIRLVVMLYVKYPFSCGMWRTCWPSAASTSPQALALDQ
jgi:hypothetical protein